MTLKSVPKYPVVLKNPATRARINRNGSDSTGSEISCDTGTIDEKLHWSDHINKIKSKASKRLYFVRKLRQFKVDRILITLFYKSAIESILSFCITCCSFFFFFFFGGGGTIRRETV